MRATSSTAPAAGSRVLVGWPEPRAQQLVAGEDVQRAGATGLDLVFRLSAADSNSRRSSRGRSAPADGRTGGYPVASEHDLIRRRGMRFDVEVHQQAVDGFGRVRDLVVAVRAACQLQPVQRALARQRLLQLPLAAEQTQQRIGAQLSGPRSPAPARRSATRASPRPVARCAPRRGRR